MEMPDTVFEKLNEKNYAGVAVIDEDVILALTAELPESFSTFIVDGCPRQ